MATPTYIVEILDNTRTPITQLKGFVPLNGLGDMLTFSNVLSSAGTCTFRLATIAPELTKFGNILQPWANHVRIKRDGAIVWQGIIGDELHRNSRYIQVVAYTYLHEYTKVLVAHKDGQTLSGGQVDDTRNFNAGTMAAAVSTIINEAVAGATGRVIQGTTLGTVQNPNFPTGYLDAAGTNIGGTAWTFSSNFQIGFAYKTTLYILAALASFVQYDFELTQNLQLNFQQRIGSDNLGVVFEYAQYGTIEEFDSPIDGKNQVNSIIGLAADINGILIKDTETDAASIAQYGKLEAVAAYQDIHNKNVLQSRLKDELRLNSTPDTEIKITLNERAYPLGQYSLGDTCTFRVKYGAIMVDEPRHIVGILVRLHTTGKEHIVLTTNKPRIYT